MIEISKNKFFILTLISLGIISSFLSIELYIDSNNNLDSNRNILNIKSNAIELSPFIIDDTGVGDYTWADAVLESWCSGLGTKSTPYLINNIEIDAMGALVNCLEIRNSNVYFIIQNSKFINSSWDGILMNNVHNGTLTNINCTQNDGAGIRLEQGCSYNSIFNCFSNDNIYGLQFYTNCDYNLIHNNTCENNEQGIYLNQGHDYNNITNNYLNHNEKNLGNDNNGIMIVGSGNHNKIADNTILYSGDNGIYLASQNNCLIYNNTCVFNGINGLYASSSSDNNITNNKIYFSTQHGIRMISNSRRNEIFGNLITNNTQRGIYLQSNSYYNTFYNNTFIGNGENARDEGQYKEVGQPVRGNYWNNSIIGNYWDDYPDIDDNDDGIGDSPYFIMSFYGTYDYLPIWFDGLTIQLITPQNNEVFKNPPAFIIEARNKTLDTFWYTLNQSAKKFYFYNNGSIDLDAWKNFNDGEIKITFYANDTHGYTNFVEVMVIKDNSTPTITINNPTPNQLVGLEAPTFSITIDEVNLLEKKYSFNGDSNITFTIETQFDQIEWDSVGNGTVIIIFYAIDMAGNINSSQVIIRKDAYEPDITIHSPITDEVFGSMSPNFTLSIIEDSLVSTWYTIDGITGTFSITELSGTIDQATWDLVPQGNVVIRFYAEDAAGNLGMNSITIIKYIQISQIPGYNLLLLIGAISMVTLIILKRHKKF
ncbi:MAG: nitrous oxide reductase family maturation protein NosD [Candidatus Thorarchaeota archaeon]